ncbi:TIR domain-containing protein [Yersinia mollaretii]|uniref:Predicted nucleotide-binding protein containing TIR-like domain n=1 Tax=Yersinia mollaretii TaxID=33060 RepID=A0AA36LI22_YERMO|nr:nucleotide-binding protein [Yersinia mollaretii]MDA5526967.1 nucleotide-binding protein [Yersinia mollaretii]MDR7872362.1 nucleotide-binding protein [Yersinia mollaretii]PHZ31808.1 hypothetical protein CS537_10130 [Yersinia mollaretii]WQC73129.1 nucleotide-binding protein [Yersinia mollaretii]CNE60341.1 Predicted nucleotide-binding protein containing TIR-like domain [Yersinia mollaretii]
MDKNKLIDDITKLQERLAIEVRNAYNQKGTEFGRQRFDAFKRVVVDYVNKNIPSEISRLNESFISFSYLYNKYSSDGDNFWRNYGESIYAYLDSLIIDIENGEIHLRERVDKSSKESTKSKKIAVVERTKVFIVHGHDGEAKSRTARFIEKLGFEAIILHEQLSRGKTIIEKIEHYSNVGFAIVLYTPDDLGNDVKSASNGNLNNRARQNVIFEHGYLIAKIGRENVIPLIQDNIEIPNDISGIVYMTDANWQLDIAREMKSSGYEIDFNKILGG